MKRYARSYITLFFLAFTSALYAAGQKPTACDFDPNCDHSAKPAAQIPETPAWLQGQIDNPTVLTSVAGITEPKVGDEYPVDGMEVLQKMKGGYLIHPFTAATDGLEMFTAVAFLKTGEDLRPGFMLSGLTTYTGVVSYTSLDGYRRNVFSFKLK